MAYFLRFFVKSAVDSQHPIHVSAWKVNSANFVITEFSEVRYPLAALSNTKHTLFGRCLVSHE
jgi:hypothetical protein